MAIPGQRKPGQTGGLGGQLSNRGKSISRGGRPSASRGGGGGGGKKGGCAVIALVGLGATLLAAAAGVIDIVT